MIRFYLIKKNILKDSLMEKTQHFPRQGACDMRQTRETLAWESLKTWHGSRENPGMEVAETGMGVRETLAWKSWNSGMEAMETLAWKSGTWSAHLVQFATCNDLQRCCCLLVLEPHQLCDHALDPFLLEMRLRGAVPEIHACASLTPTCQVPLALKALLALHCCSQFPILAGMHCLTPHMLYRQSHLLIIAPYMLDAVAESTPPHHHLLHGKSAEPRVPRQESAEPRVPRQENLQGLECHAKKICRASSATLRINSRLLLFPQSAAHLQL
jgi:hypothetical protein